MKAKPTILTLFFLLVLSYCLHSQSKPDFVFEEYRSTPSDTTWYITYRLVNQQEYEKAQQEFEDIQHHLLQESNFNDYLFIATQYSYWIYTHRKADKAKEILVAAVNNAQENLNSNHVELLIAYYTLAKLEQQLEDKISWYHKFLDNYTTDSYPRMGFIVNRDLGSRYYKLGKYQKAWEHWDVCQTEFDLPPSSYSDLYAAIGTDIAGHDFEMAIEYLAKAIELMDTTKNDIGLEIILNDNIGRSYLQNSDYRKAIKHCKRANELLKNNRDLSDFKMLNRHNRYTTIIESYARLGEYENAHKYVAELRQELPGFANPKISEGLAVYNESIIYRLDNQYEKALQKLEEYYNIDIEIHISPLSPTLVNYYLDKADIYYKTKNYKEAIANYENTLKTIGFNHYQSIDDTLKLLPPNSFHNLYLPYIRDILLEMLESYRLMIEASPSDESIDNMLKLVSYTNRIIKYHYSGMANEELAMEASAKLKRTSFYGIFAAFKKAQTNSTYIDTAFIYSDSHRAFNLNFQRKIASSYASDSAQVSLRKISDLTTRIANVQGSETANEDELFELKKALYRQKVILSANFGLSLEFMDNASDALSIKPLLDKKAAVVQYFTMGDTLFIVGHNSKHSQIELVTQNELGASIRSFIRDIRTGYKQSHWQGDFYNLLIKPMEKIIDGKKDLHIFADERLMEIPFELLASPKEKLLVEEYNIEYLYSSNGFIKQQGEKSWNLLAIAPSFAEGNIITPTSLSQAQINDKDVFRTQNDRTSLVALQHSQTEVDEIAKIFESKKLNYLKITGTEATKQRFLKEAPNYSIVHIASHGVSNTGYNSGIFFYNSNEVVMSSYFLRMPELFNIKTKADLVVLSACKTGLGEILEGEGVLALPRGFIYAGAKNVVASLWKVHDQKTKELMILFYNYLVKGKSPAEALRLAKLDCVTNGFLPLDWAGFILIGG